MSNFFGTTAEILSGPGAVLVFRPAIALDTALGDMEMESRVDVVRLENIGKLLFLDPREQLLENSLANSSALFLDEWII